MNKIKTAKDIIKGESTAYGWKDTNKKASYSQKIISLPLMIVIISGIAALVYMVINSI